ncbi:SDR family NAD(P)-dependent oxidoreductase [uncultured Marivita sp.]|uniref:SDR family NAD(P)-dependent oxidoreductase n=1 Tax=uncultured Marivita sp. TaxID=888080 RepID=UPI0026323809|nr:SDR family NAD(P)-dependent oxidoreductase [uncultured Marivita sp.]
MENTIAIVTGASSGIGAAIARTLTEAGATVIGTSRTRADFASLDVMDAASCDALVRDMLAEHGRIDLLVNNAGFAQIGGFDVFTEAEIRAAFETNLFGAMRMTRAVLPAMRAAGTGRIVNICSVVSYLPAPFMGAYAASKHALQGFSTSLDHELRGTGLRSLAVRPGFMRTDIGTNTLSAARTVEGAERVRRAVETSLTRADNPQVVARVVHRLAIHPNPPAVSDAGREASLLNRLHSLLPGRVFDRALRRNFGLS